MKDKRFGKKARVKQTISAWLRSHKYSTSLRSLKSADVLLCISESTANDVQEYLKIQAGKIVVTPLSPVVTTQKEERPSSLPEATKKYILYYGGTDERRRLAELVQGFNIYRGRNQDSQLELVFAGNELKKISKIPNIDLREAIDKSSYQSSIHLLGFITEEEKKWLLKHAEAFVYPSLYEGYGLPVAEAQALNCRVIAPNNSSLRELLGVDDIVLTDTEPRAIFDSLAVLRSTQKRSSTSSKNSSISWSDTAQLTKEVLEKK